MKTVACHLHGGRDIATFYQLYMFLYVQINGWYRFA